jgi:type IV pilus assembly protein PilW
MSGPSQLLQLHIRRRERGVTLIEIMVGLVIGLIATIIITQSLKVAEGQKRSTTSGSDAQVNGALALYTVRRDIQNAGYGLSTRQSALGCDTHGRRGGTDATWSLAPVVITDGASGAPDTITLLYADKADPALAVNVVSDHAQTATEFMVATPVSFAQGDVLLAVPKTIDANDWCTVLNVSAVVNDAAGHHIQHVVNGASPWNPTPGTVLPVAGYPTGSYVIDIGRLVRHVYSVNTVSHTLQQTETTTDMAAGAAGTALDLYSEVVNLQAMYGKDTNNDGVVDTYDNVTPTDPISWAQVKVIRMAVVARSAQYEKDAVTTSNPVWDMGVRATDVAVAGASSCGISQCISLKVDNTTGSTTDWQHYRYKVFDAVIPLRNVLWSQ